MNVIALLFGDVGFRSMHCLHVFPERTGVCVSLGAAWDLADIGFLPKVTKLKRFTIIIIKTAEICSLVAVLWRENGENVRKVRKVCERGNFFLHLGKKNQKPGTTEKGGDQPILQGT